MGPLGEATVLGLECITRLMECIFAEHATHHDPEAQKLRANDEFVYYITTVAHMSLSKVLYRHLFVTMQLTRLCYLITHSFIFFL